jgi:hypothetical protein
VKKYLVILIKIRKDGIKKEERRKIIFTKRFKSLSLAKIESSKHHHVLLFLVYYSGRKYDIKALKIYGHII